MHRRHHVLSLLTPRHFALLLAASALGLTSCANFKKLAKDVKLLDNEYRISGIIDNADSQNCQVRAIVVEWDQQANQVFSGDRLDLTTGGAFAFVVKSPLNQYVMAFADANRDGKYNRGEALWMHRGADGQPAPVVLGQSQRIVHVQGKLSPAEQVPARLLDAAERMLAGRKVEDVITRQGIRFAVGEMADLNDPRFAATRGEDGMWSPATSAIKSGFGVYFLERYNPSKIPVLFIHGMAGSPQDWRVAMDKIDRARYQPWFYIYPTGMRLESAGSALNHGIKLLHSRYQFQRLHVVAHSMGGLVAREFVRHNAILEQQPYINTLITFSTPWDGHQAAAMGVKYSPEVVPSWHDMSQGSSFLTHIYDQRLKGRVNHHLFYSTHGKRSLVLPAENDGTVSVVSQLRQQAQDDALEVRGFDETHCGILSSRKALTAARNILDQAKP